MTTIRPLSIWEIARNIIASGTDYEEAVAKLTPRIVGQGDNRDIRDAVRTFLTLYKEGDPVVHKIVNNRL